MKIHIGKINLELEKHILSYSGENLINASIVGLPLVLLCIIQEISISLVVKHYKARMASSNVVMHNTRD